MNPIRIQRKTIKGWHKPDNTVYVGGNSKWHNPLMLRGDMIYIDAGYRRKIFSKWVLLNEDIPENMDTVLELYQKICDGYVFNNMDLIFWVNRYYVLKEKYLHELKGKNLMCWCPIDKPCHADILLKLANEK